MSSATSTSSSQGVTRELLPHVLPRMRVAMDQLALAPLSHMQVRYHNTADSYFCREFTVYVMDDEYTLPISMLLDPPLKFSVAEQAYCTWM